MTVDLDTWAPGFVADLKPQLRASLTRLVDGRPREEILGLGAYTDADATSIVAVANTRAHHEALVDAHPEHRLYYLWSPGEWDLTTVAAIENGEPDDLASAVAEAERVGNEVSAGRAGQDDYGTFRYITWEAIVTALGQLFDEGFFDPWPLAVQVFDVPETEIEPSTLTEWMAEINTDAAAAQYAQWLTELYA